MPRPCWQRLELAFESRIQDGAGNLSEPVLFTMSCTAPQPIDTTPFLIQGFSTAAPIAIVLLLGFWLLFRRRPADRLPALRSMILLFFLFMLLRFLQLVFHEGGHSLYLLVSGVPITLYVHPFIFTGYSRPIIDSSIWKDILGSGIAISVGLLIFLLFWKRRSLALLPSIPPAACLAARRDRQPDLERPSPPRPIVGGKLNHWFDYRHLIISAARLPNPESCQKNHEAPLLLVTRFKVVSGLVSGASSMITMFVLFPTISGT